MKSKSRGNKTSKAERAERQAKALELMKTGATQDAIAELLGVSRMTFWRDLQAIEARYVEGSKEDVAAFKKSQYEALIRIESATAEGSIEPEVANALVRVRDSVARLLGLNAPSTSISAHVDVNPEHSQEYLLFREACAGLTEDQLHQVYAMAKALPRTWVAPPIEANFPPPMVKALEATNEAE
jgi:Homeodomain-like domain